LQNYDAEKRYGAPPSRWLRRYVNHLRRKANSVRRERRDASFARDALRAYIKTQPRARFARLDWAIHFSTFQVFMSDAACATVFKIQLTHAPKKSAFRRFF
jgi:hypothetical protein